jgi:hypothetical protein
LVFLDTAVPISKPILVLAAVITADALIAAARCKGGKPADAFIAAAAALPAAAAAPILGTILFNVIFEVSPTF